jgi:hypothetical protein
MNDAVAVDPVVPGTGSSSTGTGPNAGGPVQSGAARPHVHLKMHVHRKV